MDLGPHTNTQTASSLLLSDIDGDEKSPLDGEEKSPRDDTLERAVEGEKDGEKEGEKEGVEGENRKGEKDGEKEGREEDTKGIKEREKEVTKTRDEGILLRLSSYASCLISGAR